jgi:hypothetical protein
MAAMDRDTLLRILTHAPGLTGNEPRFEVAEDHRVTFYIGRPGRAMEVTDARAVLVESDFVAFDRGTEGAFYVAAADINGVASRPTEAKSERRAGFL